MMFTASGEPAVSTYTAEYGPGTTNGVTYANAGEAERRSGSRRKGSRSTRSGSSATTVRCRCGRVWRSSRFQTCLIYDGSDDLFPRVCADALTLQEQSATLVLNVVDEESGDGRPPGGSDLE